MRHVPKWLRVTLGIVFGISVLCCALPYWLLEWLFAPSREEVTRVTSPDGRVDAVVVEVNGGATTSFGYSLRLEPHGGSGNEEVGFVYAASQKEGWYGVGTGWKGDTVTFSFADCRWMRPSHDTMTMIAGRTYQVHFEPHVRKAQGVQIWPERYRKGNFPPPYHNPQMSVGVKK